MTKNESAMALSSKNSVDKSVADARSVEPSVAPALARSAKRADGHSINRSAARKKGQRHRSRGPKQLSLIKIAQKDSLQSLRSNTHQKIERPLDSRLPLHVCLRSEKARGQNTMLGRNQVMIDKTVRGISRKHGVRITKFVNVGNHLHLVIRLPSRGQVAREHYRKWIRAVTGAVALKMKLKIKCGSLNRQDEAAGRSIEKAPGLSAKSETANETSEGATVRSPNRVANEAKFKTGFWDARPFTRIVRGLRGWRAIDRYVLKNEFEADGWPKDVAIQMAREYFDSFRLTQSGARSTSTSFTSEVYNSCDSRILV